jgi:hypothetical protein
VSETPTPERPKVGFRLELDAELNDLIVAEADRLFQTKTSFIIRAITDFLESRNARTSN